MLQIDSVFKGMLAYRMNEFNDNKELSQYELKTKNGTAFLDYALDGDVISLLHTEVPVADRGQGAAATLVQAALDDARQRDLRVKPICAYVGAFVKRHPEYQDIVV